MSDERPIAGDAGSSTLSVHVTLDTTTPVVGGGGGYDYTVGTRIPVWLQVDGQEVSNVARTLDYLRRGAAGPAVMNIAPTPCDFLYRVGGGPVVFADPVTDPAPWYDPTRPESSQFLGIVVNDFKLGSVTRRSPVDLPGRYGGSILGARQSIGRRIDVSATIIAASVSGADYGMEWLSGLLGDAGCETCGTSTVEFRQSCPPDDGSDDDLGYWMALRTGLVSGPDIAAQDPYGNMTDVTWSWVSESPFLYKSIVNCLPEQVIDDSGSSQCVPFDTWFCGPPGSTQCCTIDPAAKGTWAGIVTIRAAASVGDVTLATFQNCPPDLVDTPADTPTEFMQIRGMQGTLIVDSSQHAITYVSPPDANGFVEVRDGTDFVYVPSGQGLQWIEVDDCDPATCICVYSTHPCSQGEQATVQIDVQYRRR